MYFFVPYNISEIQKGIQAGHAAIEYSIEHGDTDMFKTFANRHKTFIILNGGTTREDPSDRGTMQTLHNQIDLYNEDHILIDFVKYAYFREPDLNYATTAICFICDQRVWDRELVPDFNDYSNDYYAGSIGFNDLDEYNFHRTLFVKYNGKYIQKSFSMIKHSAKDIIKKLKA